MVGLERDLVHISSESGDIFFLKFTGFVAFDKGGFANAAISNCSCQTKKKFIKINEKLNTKKGIGCMDFQKGGKATHREQV